MDTWFKLNLGDATLADIALSDIKTVLANLYKVHGKPDSMLAIYRHESGELHCSLMVYLTAEFQAEAQLKNVSYCSPPQLADSAFLAGNNTYLDANTIK